MPIDKRKATKDVKELQDSSTSIRDTKVAGWDTSHIMSQVSSLIHLSDTESSARDRQRQAGYELYYARMPRPSVKGSSGFNDRTCFHHVERIKAKLLEVFTAESKAVRFEPAPDTLSPELAEKATNLANEIFYRKNNGLKILNDCFFNGLVAKSGFIRAHWDEDSEVEEIEFEGMTDQELLQLTQSIIQDIESKGDVLESIDTEGVKVDEDTGLRTGTIKVTKDISQVRLTTHAPEDVIIDEAAKSIEEASIVSVRMRATVADLLASGLTKEDIDTLRSPTGAEDYQTASKIGRDSLDFSGEAYTAGQGGTHESELKSIRETYFRTVSEDGNMVLLKILHGDEANVGSKDDEPILIEEVEDDVIPVWHWTPIPVSERMFGMSIPDILCDIQKAITQIERSIIDNTKSSNKRRFLAKISALANIGDILQNESGGVIRVNDSIASLEEAVKPLDPTKIAPESENLLTRLADDADTFSGSSRMSGGTDPRTLEGQKAGTMINALAAMSDNTRVASMARNFAHEVLKPLIFYCIALHIRNYSIEDLDEKILRENMTVGTALTPTEKMARYEQLATAHTMLMGTIETEPALAAMYPVEKRAELLRDALTELNPSVSQYIIAPEKEEFMQGVRKIQSDLQKAQEEVKAKEQFAMSMEERKADTASKIADIQGKQVELDSALKNLELNFKDAWKKGELEIDRKKVEIDEKATEESSTDGK